MAGIVDRAVAEIRSSEGLGVDVVAEGVLGVGAALPPHVVTNADLERRLDTSDAWIRKRTGVRERRRLAEGDSLAALAARACDAALADAGCTAAEIDTVIVASVTQDRVTPGLAPEVAQLVGAVGAGAYDVNAACAGFLYALDQAAALVESGRAGRVLVCGADALSRITDHEDRATAVLLADGAGAVVVGGRRGHRLWAPFATGSDAAGIPYLHADGESRLVRMQGQEVYGHAVRRMSQAMREALALARLDVGDVDLMVAHQANARIVAAVAAELGVEPSRVVSNVERVANTSAASIPIALDEARRAGRLRPGMRLGLASFGAGFVWAAGIVAWRGQAEPRRERRRQDRIVRGESPWKEPA